MRRLFVHHQSRTETAGGLISVIDNYAAEGAATPLHTSITTKGRRSTSSTVR
jgi:hypothetical protein